MQHANYSKHGLIGSRTQVTGDFAHLPIEGIPFSRLPEWPEALARVFATPAIGAAFTEYRIDLEAGQHGEHKADGEIEHFLYVLEGSAKLSLTSKRSKPATHTMKAGGYALLPPDCDYRLVAKSKASLLLLRKRFEPLGGVDLFAPLVGNEKDVKGEIYMGDKGALLKTLIPDEFAYDLAMNIFTFEVGHSLPVTETHVMEHGLYVLGGKGLYYLGDRWMEIETSDFIWMGPYCPQSYYATGEEPTRYIYYKNVNRDFEL
ncbi:MAG TPA: (S)-ureidoglycine aminohydrolase [Kiritimatiellia bacterium]|nr:(S)-ureidoglycine aminohydrolase [Kiritimatiellia bacterium]